LEPFANPEGAIRKSISYVGFRETMNGRFRPLVDLRIREKRTFADLAERPKAVAARVAGAGVDGSLAG
jgi:hypothetical protein